MVFGGGAQNVADMCATYREFLLTPSLKTVIFLYVHISSRIYFNKPLNFKITTIHNIGRHNKYKIGIVNITVFIPE